MVVLFTICRLIHFTEIFWKINNMKVTNSILLLCTKNLDRKIEKNILNFDQ